MSDHTPRNGAEWHAIHPRFETDAGYRAAATQAHWNAVGRGCVPDTPSYFDSIEHELQGAYGPGHGRDGSQSTDRQRGRDGETIASEFGDISVRQRADGKTSIAVSPDVRSEWEAAAAACNMSLSEYGTEQARIARENEDNIGRRVPRATVWTPPPVARDVGNSETLPPRPAYLGQPPEEARGADRPWLRRT